jgi:hypothetical protein
VFEQIKSLIEKEAFHTLGVTMLAIALATSKTFLFEHLLNKDGQGLVEVHKGDKLCQVMDKFIALSSLNVWNVIASFMHRPGNKGYVFSIFSLKVNNGYYYIQDNYFLRQQIGEKMFVFKMSLHGDGRYFDLVKWI